jgi:hypothetical protein
MATKKAMRGPVDDHDDAHFDGNPAYKSTKRGAKKPSVRGKKKMSGRKSSKR